MAGADLMAGVVGLRFRIKDLIGACVPTDFFANRMTADRWVCCRLSYAGITLKLVTQADRMSFAAGLRRRDRRRRPARNPRCPGVCLRD